MNIPLSKSARRRALTAGALIAPVLLVQTVRTLFHRPNAPGTVSAASVAPANDLPVTPAIKLPAPVQSALRFAREQRPTSDLVSPMDHGSPALAAPQSTPTNESGEPDPLVGLAVSSVFGNARNQMATINGRVYTLGSEVARGWSVCAIDTKTTSVTLTGPGGATRTLSVENDLKP